MFEDGKEQTVSIFEEISPIPYKPAPRSSSANTFSNYGDAGRGERQVTIFLLDLLNTDFSDQVYARSKLIKYLEERADSAQISCLLALGTSGITVIHDFADDPAVLVDALQWTKKNEKKLSSINSHGTLLGTEFPNSDQLLGEAPNSQSSRYRAAVQKEAAELQRLQKQVDIAIQYDRTETTLQSLTQVARTATGIPGRKSLVWISSAFPDFRGDLDRPPRIAELYREMWTSMSEAQISVYPVDARGLVNPGYVDASDEATFKGALNGPMYSAKLEKQSTAHNLLISTMRMVADATGGVAFFNRNDLESGLQRVREDNGHYYLLGYYRLPKEDQRKKNGHSGAWRELNVRVDQQHVEVRARRGFYENGPIDVEKKWAADVQNAVASPVDFTAIPIRADFKIGVVSENEPKGVRFVVYIPPSYQAILPEGKNIWLDVAAVATDEEGKVVDRMVQRLAKEVDGDGAAKIRQAGVSCSGMLHLGKGEYTVHFIVRNGLNDGLGSVSARLKLE